MKLNISGKHIDIGSSLRQHIEDHLTRTLDKYFDEVVDATVHVHQERSHVHTEISVHVGRGMILRGEATTEDPYHAVEQAIHKIESNVRRYKDRAKAHHTAAKEILHEQAAKYVLDKGYRNLDESEEHHEPVVIAELTKEIPVLTVSDAVMRMELENVPVLLFKNSAHGHLNAVYLRTDGDIGWIDPHGKTKKLKG